MQTRKQDLKGFKQTKFNSSTGKNVYNVGANRSTFELLDFPVLILDLWKKLTAQSFKSIQKIQWFNIFLK